MSFQPIDFQQRRDQLLEIIGNKYADTDIGAVALFANFETGSCKFKQESSFYYFTGINEPGAAMLLSLDGTYTLYVPNSGVTRSNWMNNVIHPAFSDIEQLKINELKHLGSEIKGYEFYPFFSMQEYSTFLNDVNDIIISNGKLFVLNPDNHNQYFQQRFVLNRLSQFEPKLLSNCIDISHIVAQLRRVKDKKEIEAIYKAIDITITAHESAIQAIEHDKLENEVQAAIEFIFTAAGAQNAFASIVGSGKNSTILHYTDNNKKLNKGDLVVVDIGAEYGHYSADLTRTYPVTGKFTKRQREVYEVVLATQEYIESIAKPGLWLSNKDKPEKSLNHLAREFLKERGYDKYFLHGIGHFLGLDVHDVGNYMEPLQVGDVITIEPGIYIPQENLGVRIEDNYWIVEDGVVNLSEQLPKTVSDIEDFFANKDDDSDEE